MQECIGREREKRILETALNSQYAEMIAITGRRRVGKTFLIRSFFKEMIDFEMIGIHNASVKVQLKAFSDQLSNFAPSLIQPATPINWTEAFRQLTAFLERKKTKRKKVVFIDELPWIATPKSGFMGALEYFWNNWASQKNIVVILCGSAASWMLQKLVHDKGGLHNRITRFIQLEPFTLNETQQYFESGKIKLDPYQIIQIYMVTGGIPHYLKEVQTGQSAAQNIDRMCFEPQGFLKDEFDKLYSSLFDHPENHIKIIRALAKKRNGLTRKQIVEEIAFQDGGSFSRLLEELETSGFITAYTPFGKQKKQALYRLTDEYSLFYIKFMERSKASGQGAWLQLSQTQAWKIWSGYAYENICLKHIDQIKLALGIQGIYSEASSFYFAGNDRQQGVQVDLLIDRNDRVVNVCEIKFHEAPFSLTKAAALELRQKVATFQAVTGTRKQLSLTLITAFGFQHNEHSLGLVQQTLAMEALFAPRRP